MRLNDLDKKKKKSTNTFLLYTTRYFLIRRNKVKFFYKCTYEKTEDARM